MERRRLRWRIRCRLLRTVEKDAATARAHALRRIGIVRSNRGPLSLPTVGPAVALFALASAGDRDDAGAHLLRAVQGLVAAWALGGVRPTRCAVVAEVTARTCEIWHLDGSPCLRRDGAKSPRLLPRPTGAWRVVRRLPVVVRLPTTGGNNQLRAPARGMPFLATLVAGISFLIFRRAVSRSRPSASRRSRSRLDHLPARGRAHAVRARLAAPRLRTTLGARTAHVRKSPRTGPPATRDRGPSGERRVIGRRACGGTASRPRARARSDEQQDATS